ncbi:MAG: hypothetical protein H6873_05370 [Hyphomicrobiaceae bacterium]|nr:hypothetical protein [Hyphomicrobiaceae bacterium]
MSASLDQQDDRLSILDLPAEEVLVAITEQALRLANEKGRRVLIGIVGGPGSGKSTMAKAVTGMLNEMVPGCAVTMPMDGFHRRHADLVASGEVEQKGAPDTFDAEGFTALLAEVRDAGSDVRVPTYSRKIEDVVPEGPVIGASVPIVVVEGNYLLLDEPRWAGVRPLLDRSFFLDVDRETVRARLLKRHAEHGLFSEERNIAHVDRVDLSNYDLVDQSKVRADQIYRVSDAT